MIVWMSLAVAGPWTKEEGQTYAKVGADFYQTTKYVLPAEGGLGSTGDFGTTGFFGHQYSVYVETGVSNGWPVQMAVRLPLTVSDVGFEVEDAINEVEGTALSIRMGDLELMPQVALSRKVPLAFALGVKLPLYNVDNVCKASVYQDFCGRPGDGQTDFTPWLLGGTSFAKGKAWVEGQVGYRFRTEVFRNWRTERAFVDSVAFGGTLGGKLGRFIGMVRLDGNRNLSGLLYVKSYDSVAIQRIVDRNDGEDPFTMQSVRIGPQAMVMLNDHFALEARTAFDVWARSTSIGVGAGVGLSWSGDVRTIGR